MQVASGLKLPHFFTDHAHRLYALALQRNFTFGRRQLHVVATCLYIVCRQQKDPHLLIDFSDLLRVNVYVLGKNYLQFVRLLNMKIDVIDPSLFIHRFAQRLDFGDKLTPITFAAMRFVKRFDKDWITIGECAF